MKATETLARFISNLQYKDLPASVVEAAKVAIIDGVANMLAGSAQPLAAVMGEYVREMGGSPKCSVVGWGFKTNAPSAAFANGVFGHCLDFEIQGHPPQPWHILLPASSPGPRRGIENMLGTHKGSPPQADGVLEECQLVICV